jgi:diaminobutyrate-2-oxoglutarate transaminase
VAVERKHRVAADRLTAIAAGRPELGAHARGRGLMLGLDLGVPGLAGRVAAHAFERGLVIETSGPGDRVLKLLPPLTIADEDLRFGLDVIEEAVDATVATAAPVTA